MTAARSCHRPTTAISAAIDAVGALADIPRAAVHDRIGADVVDAYVERLRALLAEIGTATTAQRAALRVVYTPLHGVGGTLLRRCMVDAGFAEPVVVPEQADPDPDFPTVPFPNPEEKGAIDAAVALARSVDADLVIANDPDADRCALAVPDLGGWRMLTGDEVGVLLGRRLLAARPDGVFAASIVSSAMLGALAPGRVPGTRRRSPASSGSAGCPNSPSATRRRSATAPIPRPFATRTASPRHWCSPTSRHRRKQPDGRSSRISTPLPWRWACTPPGRSAPASTIPTGCPPSWPACGGSRRGRSDGGR